MKNILLGGYAKAEYLQPVLNQKRLLKDIYSYQLVVLPGDRDYARKLEPQIRKVSWHEALTKADGLVELSDIPVQKEVSLPMCKITFSSDWLPDVLALVTEFSQAGYPFYLAGSDKELDRILLLTRFREENVPFQIVLEFEEGKNFDAQEIRTRMFAKAAMEISLSSYCRILMERFEKENWKKNYLYLSETDVLKKIYLTCSKQIKTLTQEEYQVLKALEKKDVFSLIGVERKIIETIAAMCIYEYLENERIEALLRTGLAEIENYDDVIISFLGSRRCNLSCRYCFSDHRCEALSKMTGSDALLIADMMAGNRENVNLHFDNNLGGEPIEDFQAVKDRHNLLASYQKNGGFKATFGLLTNGTKLEEDHLFWLRNHNPYLGVSLDGDKSTHDKIRRDALGQPTYEKTVQGIQMIQKNNWPVDIGVSMVLSRNNMDVQALEHHVREELKVPNIVMKPVRAAWSSDFALTDNCMDELKKQYKKFFAYLIEEGKKGNLKPFYTMMQPLDYAGRFLLRTFFHDRYIVKRCGSGEHIFSVADDGKVYPCDSFNGETGYELADLKRGFHNEHGYKVPMVMDESPDYGCRDCPVRYLCGGICTYVKHLNGYAHNEVTKQECELARFLIEESLLFWETAKERWSKIQLKDVEGHIQTIGFKKTEKSSFFYAPC